MLNTKLSGNQYFRTSAVLSGCHININATVAWFCFEEITMSTSSALYLNVQKEDSRPEGSWKVRAVNTERKLCISLGPHAEILRRFFSSFWPCYIALSKCNRQTMAFLLRCICFVRPPGLHSPAAANRWLDWLQSLFSSAFILCITTFWQAAPSCPTPEERIFAFIPKMDKWKLFSCDYSSAAMTVKFTFNPVFYRIKRREKKVCV